MTLVPFPPVVNVVKSFFFFVADSGAKKLECFNLKVIQDQLYVYVFYDMSLP